MKHFYAGYFMGAGTILVAAIPFFMEISNQRDQIRDAAKIFVSQVPDRLKLEFDSGVIYGIAAATNGVSDKFIENTIPLTERANELFKGENAE